MMKSNIPWRGIVLAGGKGTRLGELTKVTNKHLLPVGPKPMVYYPIEKLVGAGIQEILLVSGTEHMGDFVELLGSGKNHGCSLTYRCRMKRAALRKRWVWPSCSAAIAALWSFWEITSFLIP